MLSSFLLLTLLFKGSYTFNLKCPDGWEGFSASRNCYKFFSRNPDSFDVAKITCEAYYGRLAVIENQEVANYLSKRVGEHTGEEDSWWLGLSLRKDNENEERWKWINGHLLTDEYVHWEQEEPKPNKPPACGTLTRNGRIASEKCAGVEKAFICERYIGAPPRCPEGWISHDEKCYKEIYDMDILHLDFWSARKTCRDRYNADLPIIRSQTENSLIYSLAMNSERDMWIGIREDPTDTWTWLDGTPAGADSDTFTSWLNSENEHQPVSWNGTGRGVMLRDGLTYWATMDSSQELSYVCQQDAGNFCFQGMYKYHDWCYTFELDEGKDLLEWPVARDKCRSYGMDLPVLQDNNTSEWFNDQLIDLDVFYPEKVARGVWLGLTETEENSERFIWVDGKSIEEEGYDGRVPDLTYNSKKADCFWFAPCDNGDVAAPCTPVTQPDARWINDNCAGNEIPHLFGCQIGIDKLLDVTGLENSKKYCPDGWELFVDTCFISGDVEETWSDAKSWCEEKAEGADLASIHSPAENDFISNLISRTAGAAVWTGLNKRELNDWTWSDSSSFSYLNWVDGQPTENTKLRCGTINSNQEENIGQWNPAKCTDLKNFVCKVMASDHSGGPPVTTTESSSNCGYHSEGWREDPYTGMCYHFLDKSLTWEDAREECRYMSGYHGEGDLASINSFEENTFIQTFIQDEEGLEGRWIGLTDHDKETSFIWSDGSPLAYVNWNDGEPNGAYEGEDCVVIVPSLGGEWNDERCGLRKYAVCEKKGYNYKPSPTPAPPTVKCDPDWDMFGDKCFYIGESEVLNYQVGEEVCQSMNPVAHLASVKDQSEYDFLQERLIAKNQGSAYLGATNLNGDWTWTDGTPFSFSPWGSGEPSGGNEHCLVNEMSEDAHGEVTAWWNDVNCEERAAGYVCSYSNSLCPSDWSYWGGFCWFSSVTKATFDKARQMCADVNSKADLASIANELDNWFISDLELQHNTGSAYIGLQRTGENWSWSDGSDASFSDAWDEGQPSDDGDCVLATKEGKWRVANCSTFHRYDCKMKTTNYYGCPTGWSLNGGHCYLLQDDQLTWEAADTSCKAKGADLVSILSYAEQEEVFSELYSGPNCPDGFFLDAGNCLKVRKKGLAWQEAKEFCENAGATLMMVKSEADEALLERNLKNVEDAWLGGTDAGHEGQWTWVDGTDFTYTKWGDPSNTDAENCLLVSKSSRTWDDRNCSDVHSFVCRVGQAADGAPRWIGLTDRASYQTFEWSDQNPVVYTHWGTGMPSTSGGKAVCVYMNSLYGGWKHTDCTDKMGSICKMDATISGPPDNEGCLQDEVAYRGSCYKFQLAYQDFQSAREQCEGYEGHLLSLQSDYEQAKISTLVADLGVHFYVGMKLNQDSGSFEWVSGEPVTYTHWAEGEPDINHKPDGGDGFCVYMHRHDDIGFWKVSSCAERMASICELPRHGYTEPPTTTTTVPPQPQCANEINWTLYNDHCYRIFHEEEVGNSRGLNFDDAREFCRTQGGDLITFTDADEEYNFMGYYYLYSYAYWIGMKQTTEGNQNEGEGYSWIDDTPFSYTNWAYDFPNSHEGRENCIAKDSMQGYLWRNYNCEETIGVICETLAGIEPVTTDVAPTAPPKVSCGHGMGEEWIVNPADETYCYAFYAQYYGDIGNGFSFRKAEGYCANQGGQLASIHSQDENRFIRAELEDAGGSAAWIGLTSLNLDDGYENVDGSPADYFNWGENEPNNWSDQESCANIDPRNGYWNDAACGNEMSFVCKKPRDGDFTTAVTDPFPPGHCPRDWLEFEGRCYKVFSNEDDYANWTYAREVCKGLTISRSYHNAELASIHSRVQTAFLVAEISKYPEQSYWIGLSTVNTVFGWSDETDFDFNNWARNEPNGYYGDYCGEMYGDQDNSGQWNDDDCFVQKGFICEINAVTSIPTESPIDWTPCSNTELADRGFVQLKDSCYKIEGEGRTWSEARSRCTEYGNQVHLTSVLNKLEEDLLFALANPSDFWLGLKMEDDTWSWEDGWPVEYTHWDEFANATGSCASFSAREGTWLAEDCENQLQFACKYNEVDPPTPPPQGSCPDGWVNLYENKCYKFVEESVPWNDARTGCWQLQGSNGEHADLVSIHSQEESDALLNNLPENYAEAYWIGLRRSGANFDWTDDSPFQFNNWNDNEPNNEWEECAEAIYVNMKWNDNSCLNYRYYICMTTVVETTVETTTEVQTEPSVVTSENWSTEPPTTRPDGTTTPPRTTEWRPKTTTVPENQATTEAGSGSDSGLSTGSVVVIVLVVLAVGVVAAAMLLQLRKNDWDWRRTLARRRNPLLNSSSFSNISYRSGTNSVTAS